MPDLPSERHFGDYGAWPGRAVIGSDGDAIGEVHEIYLDRATGRPEWVLVRIDGTGQRFIPLGDANVEGETLRVAHSAAAVRDAPDLGGELRIDIEQEKQLHDHYAAAAGGPEAQSEPEPEAAEPEPEPVAADPEPEAADPEPEPADPEPEPEAADPEPDPEPEAAEPEPEPEAAEPEPEPEPDPEPVAAAPVPEPVPEPEPAPTIEEPTVSDEGQQEMGSIEHEEPSFEPPPPVAERDPMPDISPPRPGDAPLPEPSKALVARLTERPVVPIAGAAALAAILFWVVRRLRS